MPSSPYASDRNHANPNIARHVRRRGASVSSKNCANLIICGPISAAETAFAVHVDFVVGVCPNEQVVRIAASPVVAFVADHQFVLNRAERKFPCHSGGNGNAPRSISFTADAELAIAILANGFLPRPASIFWAFENAVPKAIRHIFGWVMRLPMLSAKCCADPAPGPANGTHASHIIFSGHGLT